MFSNFRGAREIFGVFRVKNHDFTPKNLIFFPILGGGGRAGYAPPGSVPNKWLWKLIMRGIKIALIISSS